MSGENKRIVVEVKYSKGGSKVIQCETALEAVDTIINILDQLKVKKITVETEKP